MTKERTRINLALAALATLLAIGSAAAQEGQADLDKAMDLKITASTLQELSEVASLCEKAIQAGLNADDEAFAKKLLTGSLYQYASQLCQPMLRSPRMTPELKELRDRVLKELARIVKYDDRFGQAYLMEAQLQALEGGDRKKALEAIDRAIACLEGDKKASADALVFRAQIQESDEQRVADFGRALELDPENIDAWQARALYHLRRGEMEKAIADFNRLLEKDSDNILSRLALAEALMNVGQLAEAQKQIDVVIEKQPLAVALTLRARLWIQQEKFDEAIKDLDAAIKLEPNSLPIILMRARLYHAVGRNALALQDVDQVLRVRPDVAELTELRSSILASLGKFEEAVKDITTLLEKDPDNILIKLQLAIYVNAAGRSPKAIELFTDVLKADPGNGVAHRGRADAYLSIGEHEKAVADYEVAIKTADDDSGILNNFAWLLATSPDDRLRNGKRALELAQKACELTDYQQAHILSTLAAAYAESGDFESAIKWSQKAVDAGDETVKEQLQQELESYQQKKPWRERKQGVEPNAADTDKE